MNWIRITGAIVSLAGSGLFIISLLGSMPMTNGSAGIGAVGAVHLLELFFGVVLVIIGLCIVIIGRTFEKASIDKLR